MCKQTRKGIALTFENMGIPLSNHITIAFTQTKGKFQNSSMKPITKQTKDTQCSSNYKLRMNIK